MGLHHSEAEVEQPIGVESCGGMSALIAMIRTATIIISIIMYLHPLFLATHMAIVITTILFAIIIGPSSSSSTTTPSSPPPAAATAASSPSSAAALPPLRHHHTYGDLDRTRDAVKLTSAIKADSVSGTRGQSCDAIGSPKWIFQEVARVGKIWLELKNSS